MLDLVLGTVLGVCLGTISGLIPGVHANTMAGILLGLQATLVAILGPVALAAAMMAALITHTFLDIVPSTFLGVPDADTALSVLPAHALCLEGHGEEAIRVSALGSASAVILGIPLCLLFFALLPSLQPLIDWWIGILLIAVMGVLIIYAETPFWSLILFLSSGALGVFTIRYSFFSWNTLGGGSELLMPLLSGLFGIAVLLNAAKGRMPPQTFEGIKVKSHSLLRDAALGTSAGALVGWLPGLSTASSNGLLATVIRYEHDRRSYIFATSAANTANAITGLAALYAISRMRNGVMVALASIELPPFSALLTATTIAAFLAYLLTVFFSRSAERFNGVDIRKVNLAVILFVGILSFLLTGPFGILILLLATALGVVPSLLNVPRVTCMGAVMVPVLLFSFGVTI
ncbi:MAG: tripartite tricarboxylate transporter permease [Methanomicrobiales archaeon]|nr:tripartite tricarboxylate transporter permease [Methanomicrobiales archaeon]